ncbi:major facilitator superfamily MFS_1 [Beutenbergia cavernae DSM 12333]|uniref:Major facilitator superfamily MFS_1 n=1 Tax=Beutenbergia cavernae (strain ATCC BAA-8 / DSM 12333 / CCUG 43141 / JCM 11478 / NBRC 16432 / NCIMB 13614 / HKI 0122) TaxID=471853 RepID=C5BVC3_BEUC1|nr:MFS transporter [Beutenbergia cavernae]ACQ80510.1 major facilitator superfamily MFS_1 [Beutenbergia cavernae DSM 12333]
MSALAAWRRHYRLDAPGLTFREKVLIAMPLPAAMMSSVLIHNVYVKFYTDVIGLEPQYVGWVYLAFNIWNVLNDPVFGVVIDRMSYRTGKGKFLRVMRVTAPFMVLGLVAMAWAQPTWSQATLFVVFLAQLFLFDVAATFFTISATSYGYVAAPTREQRLDVDVVRSWLSNGFSFLATVVATQLLVGDLVTEHTTMALLLMGVALVNGAIYAVALANLKDPPELYARGNAEGRPTWPELRRDVLSILRMRAFWTWFGYGLLAQAPMGVYFTAFLYFMDHVVRSQGFEATIADTAPMILVLAALPFVANAVKRIGGKRSIFLGSVPYVAGFAALFWLATAWWHVGLCYLLIMFGRYTMSTAGAPLEAALIDENEMLTGTRKTGLFASVRALLSAPVAGAQLAIFMAIIGAFGYDGTAPEQSAGAVLGIRVATALVPIAFCLLGLVPLVFFPYGREKERELSEFSLARRTEAVQPTPAPSAAPGPGAGDPAAP